MSPRSGYNAEHTAVLWEFSGIMKQKIQMENLSPAERGTMSCPSLIIIVLGCLIYARYFNAVSVHSVKTFH